MFYANEFDEFAAEWLRNLFPSATVDHRNIRDVRAEEIERFTRAHFFAGIGGWELALRWAGWPEAWPVWTGSCPCQPFSTAGKRKGTADHRHVWPEFRRLIAKRKPPAIFGEQVASGAGREWLAGVRTDLERLGYAVGAADLCAASVGAPQIRQRLWWCALDVSDADREQWNAGEIVATECRTETPQRPRRRNIRQRGAADDLAGLSHGRREGMPKRNSEPLDRSEGLESRADLNRCGDLLDLGDSDGEGLARLAIKSARQELATPERTGGAWRNTRIILCRDGKARRVSAQPGDEPLVDGIPRGLGRSEPRLASLVRRARSNRVGRLRGYGNAIVPILAAQFVRSVMDFLWYRVVE